MCSDSGVMDMHSLDELMSLSEDALWRASEEGEGRRRRAASWVTSDFRMLETWRLRHREILQPVAAARHHFGQAARLRAAGVAIVERCAFVDYLRERRVAAASRDDLIAKVRDSDNTRRAVLDEHREYVLALCSAMCIDHLLSRVGDPLGPRLLQKYRSLYVEYFTTTSDRLLFGEGRSPRERIADAALPPEAKRLKRVLTLQPV